MWSRRAIFVRVIKREKRACRGCEQGTVTMAALAPRIVEKGLASDRVVVDTVVAKYCDHLPLYRQAVMLEREAGLEIGRATLDGWVMRVGELLQPVRKRHAAGSAGASRICRPTKRPCRCRCTTNAEQIIKRTCGNTASRAERRSSTFAWVADARVRRSFWDNWEGILQTDGYQAYDGVGGPKLVHVGCWAHARRKFVDAVKVNPQDAEAVKMVTRMDALFLVDRDAREQADERRGAAGVAARACAAVGGRDSAGVRERSAKLILPKSALGKAVSYTLNMWPKLRRCFDYAEVELSNNLAENSMRPVALGRKNWLHVGSAKAGPKVAAILSVVESCRRLGVSVKDYLLDVLPGMSCRTTSETAQLTPARWLAARC